MGSSVCLHKFMTNTCFYSRLAYFISGKPASLVEFKCIGARTIGVFHELSRHIPNIERVSEIEYSANTAAFNNNNDGSARSFIPNNFQGRWKYFNEFHNLKDVSLRSHTVDFSDSGEAFSIMAKRNTVEKMKLTFGWNASNEGKI